MQDVRETQQTTGGHDERATTPQATEGPLRYYQETITSAQNAANRDGIRYFVIARTSHTQGSGTQYEFCHPDNVSGAEADGWTTIGYTDPES